MRHALTGMQSPDCHGPSTDSAGDYAGPNLVPEDACTCYFTTEERTATERQKVELQGPTSSGHGLGRLLLESGRSQRGGGRQHGGVRDFGQGIAGIWDISACTKLRGEENFLNQSDRESQAV